MTFDLYGKETIMGLFFDYARPGPGVAPDEPRKTGLPRIWEMISRDFSGFWRAGMLNLIFTCPFLFGMGFACATHSLLLALLTGLLGGLLAAPSFLGLADTLLRSLRDEPGFWWYRYSLALRRGWKGTLLPGALLGTVFSMQIFTLMHMHLLGGGLGLFLCQVASMLLSAGLFAWVLPQQALLELRFPALVKNSLLLFFRYLPKTLAAAGILLAFALAAYLTFPLSAFVLLATGFWLPLLCAFQIVYPLMDRVFGIEEQIEKNREHMNDADGEGSEDSADDASSTDDQDSTNGADSTDNMYKME